MIKVCIVGYGNIGKSVLEAVQASKDMVLCGIVRRDTSSTSNELSNIQVVTDVDKLSTRPDVAILCTPSRLIPVVAPVYLEKEISTVDSFDIHSSIVETKAILDKACKSGSSAAITAAGWDPGSDSVVRALMESCAPKGITYTNFGPGMSMGHTVAVKAIAGVKAALSMTIPLGTGIHRRMVYIELLDGYNFSEVASAIKNDPYFIKDETHVTAVESVEALLDMGHGVHMSRKGVSGTTQNQIFSFDMTINNPALTAQNLVNCARAVTRQQPGCYTMIEIPVIDLLYGDRNSLIARLV